MPLFVIREKKLRSLPTVKKKQTRHEEFSFELLCNNFPIFFSTFRFFLLVAVGHGATRDGKQRTD